jgi:glycosyltransferase involved in cell wall biosynthesis
VAVIVPFYNEEATLPACLDSLLKLDYPAGLLELIFVDNNSSDRSVSIVEREAGRIELLHESTPGAGAARNCAIRNTRAEIIAFTDADCFVEPDWLKQLIVPLLTGRGALASGGRILSRQTSSYIERYGEQIHDHKNAIEKFSPPYLITMNMAVSRQNILDVGLFDENMLRMQDCDLSFRLWESGTRFAYVESALVYHHNQEKMSGLFTEGFRHGFWKVRLIEKHRATLFRSRSRSLMAGAPRIGSLLGEFLGASKRERTVAQTELCSLVFQGGKKCGMMWSALNEKFLKK